MVFKLADHLNISKLKARLPVTKIAQRGALFSFATFLVTGVLLGVRHLGGLEPLELAAFDQMMRSASSSASLSRSPETTPDTRLLIITITEKDIRSQQKWPIPDRVLAQLLQKLQANQPAAIGLDLYRDIPVEPGRQDLATQLKQPNIFAIQSIDTYAGATAPPGVPPDRIGFNDLAVDPDNGIRRNILFAETKEGVLYSLSLRLALAYLQQQGIEPQASKSNPDALQLGPSVFEKLSPNAGGYHHAETAGYQILLNYRQPNNIARQISLTEALSGQLEPNLVKGKIVIIGSTAPSLKDQFTTPFSATLRENYKMPGVLIHAQMVSQFLDAATGKRPLFWFWSEEVEALWIITWILLGGILGRGTYHPLVLSIGVALGLWSCAFIGFYVFVRGGWIPLAAPALGFVLAVSLVVAYRAYHAHLKQQIVMKLLGQNTSPQIAQALWQGRDRLLKSGKLPGIRLTATMLFADIKDFSTTSELMTPEALLEWLNQFLGVMTHEIIQRQGIVNKFTGDGVMAVFGVPTCRLDTREVAEDARAAVACALAISDRLEEMNQNWQRLDLPIIQMRIGIFTGTVVAGSLGGKDRLEYGVIGDSVNTASRLESCEKQRQPSNCRILIGQETMIHLQGQFETESWGALALKGKQQMVEVHHVIEPRRQTFTPIVAQETQL
jgi:adenylate cyclase